MKPDIPLWFSCRFFCYWLAVVWFGLMNWLVGVGYWVVNVWMVVVVWLWCNRWRFWFGVDGCFVIAFSCLLFIAILLLPSCYCCRLLFAVTVLALVVLCWLLMGKCISYMVIAPYFACNCVVRCVGCIGYLALFSIPFIIYVYRL